MCYVTNNEVFDAFARRLTADGGSVRSKRTATGTVLYSYATPIAFLPDSHDIPTFTLRRFSSTTSKQQAQARAKFPTVRNVRPESFEREAREVDADFAFAR